jgi:hypothetical protein
MSSAVSAGSSARIFPRSTLGGSTSSAGRRRAGGSSRDGRQHRADSGRGPHRRPRGRFFLRGPRLRKAMVLVEGIVTSLGETPARFYLNFGPRRGVDFAMTLPKRSASASEAGRHQAARSHRAAPAGAGATRCDIRALDGSLRPGRARIARLIGPEDFGCRTAVSTQTWERRCWRRRVRMPLSSAKSFSFETAYRRPHVRRGGQKTLQIQSTDHSALTLSELRTYSEHNFQIRKRI